MPGPPYNILIAIPDIEPIPILPDRVKSNDFVSLKLFIFSDEIILCNFRVMKFNLNKKYILVSNIIIDNGNHNIFDIVFIVKYIFSFRFNERLTCKKFGFIVLYS